MQLKKTRQNELLSMIFNYWKPARTEITLSIKQQWIMKIKYFDPRSYGDKNKQYIHIKLMNKKESKFPRSEYIFATYRDEYITKSFNNKLFLRQLFTITDKESYQLLLSELQIALF